MTYIDSRSPSKKFVRVGFLLWMVLVFGGFWLLWMGSSWSVDNVHAVALEDSQFIHGSDLTCKDDSSDGFNRVNCLADVSGKPLSVNISTPIGGSSAGCGAEFSGSKISCSLSTNNSLVAPIVELEDVALAESAAADGSVTSNWRNFFLGRSDKSAKIAASIWGISAWAILGIICSRRFYSRPQGSKPSLLSALLFLFLLPISWWLAYTAASILGYF